MTYSVWYEPGALELSITRHSDMALFELKAVPRDQDRLSLWDIRIVDQQSEEEVYSTTLFCSISAARSYVGDMANVLEELLLDVNNLIEFVYRYGGLVNGMPIVAPKRQGTH